jgi:hypothetical protein
MPILLERVETELKLPREQVIEEGVHRYLEGELRNLSIEVSKLCSKYGVNNFNGLIEKLERGEVSESECFDDLTRLEYLELEREKVEKLLEEEAKG